MAALPALSLNEDEDEVLRHIQFDLNEKSRSALIRELLRTSPLVQEKIQQLRLDDGVVFAKREWGSKPKGN